MKQLKEILWMSISIPYDGVDHAGGKIHNFYIKKVHESKDFRVKLISFCEKREFGKDDLEQYHIDADICYIDRNIKSIICKKLWNIESTLNPFTQYANAMSNYRVYECLRRIRKLHRKGYKPDVVILQWTPLVLLQKKIKRYFPDSKYIAIEEDVMFQNYERRYLLEDFLILKYFYKKRFEILEKKELLSLKEVDLIYVNNNKDYSLLKKNDINSSQIRILVPYYDHYFNVRREINSQYKDILFYGAMSRKENYTSAIWFINNVFCKIKDPTVRFVIIGSHPHESLKKLQNERIIVTGFVKNVSIYFTKCICMVVPLFFGAGIKIKVLEGFSAGVPILTNNVGMEGIGGSAGKEYFHCESPQDYIDTINQIISDEQSAWQIGENGRKFVKERFDYYEYAKIMVKNLREI